MKALVLAAGFGKRLAPYTRHTPKPLFTLGGRTLLDIVIHRLQAAGCTAVLVNTHHLHEKIESFLKRRQYSIQVFTRYEPEILGTGGAVRNAADFWDHRPFLVVNSDILFDIDLAEVYRFHLTHAHPVTLVLCDDPQFNTVSVDDHGRVMGFARKGGYTGSRRLTFTGIQVVDPAILARIPAEGYVDSIDVYTAMLRAGETIAAFIPPRPGWRDLGTLERYRHAAFAATAARAFAPAGSPPLPSFQRRPIQGDGSDRCWYRVSTTEPGANAPATMVMADHGIRESDATAEVDAFIAIGRHLHRQGLPVPRIHAWDAFAGLVLLEDLGDVHLARKIQNAAGWKEIRVWYQRAVDLLIRMSRAASVDFQTAWTYQSAHYDRPLILTRECGYFMDAFVRGYLGRAEETAAYAEEFSRLARQALDGALLGFMHRDLQSRNIMVRDHRLYLIDFQGGRIGPLQYDLASLLIDPYVALPGELQYELLAYAEDRLDLCRRDAAAFRRCYHGCALARNLQMLGAFGFLSRVKGKPGFAPYIPQALKTLLTRLQGSGFPRLTALVEDIVGTGGF